MWALFFALLISVHAGCLSHQGTLGSHIADAESVLRIEILSDPRVLPSRTNDNTQQGGTRVYSNVRVLNVYKGSCIPNGQLAQVRQIINLNAACDILMVRAGGQERAVVDLVANNQAPTSGRYIVAGAVRPNGEGKQVFFVDPDAFIRSDHGDVLGANNQNNAPHLVELRDLLRAQRNCYVDDVKPLFTGVNMNADDKVLAAGFLHQKVDIKIRSQLTAIDFIPSLLSEGRKDLPNPYAPTGPGVPCFFKADRPIANKEFEVCIDAEIGKKTCGSQAVIDGKGLIRSWRSVLSSAVAEVAHSPLIALTWSVRYKSNPVALGSAMAPSPQGFYQVQTLTRVPVYVALTQNKRVMRVNSLTDTWNQGQSRAIAQNDVVSSPLQPANGVNLGGNTYVLVFESVLDHIFCKDQRLRMVKAVADAVQNIQLSAQGVPDALRLVIANGPQELARSEENTVSFSPPLQISKYKDANPHPQIVSDLIELQLLDQISGQTDRNFQNFFVSPDPTIGIPSVYGIDLDMAWGKSANPFRIPMVINDRNRLDGPPFVTVQTARRIRRITPEVLDGLYALVPESSRQFLFLTEAKARLKTIHDHLKTLETNGKIIPISEVTNNLQLLTPKNSIYGRWQEQVVQQQQEFAKPACAWTPQQGGRQQRQQGPVVQLGGRPRVVQNPAPVVVPVVAPVVAPVPANNNGVVPAPPGGNDNNVPVPTDDNNNQQQ